MLKQGDLELHRLDFLTGAAAFAAGVSTAWATSNGSDVKVGETTMTLLLFVVALLGIGLGFAISRRRRTEHTSVARRLTKYACAERGLMVEAVTASYQVALLEDFAAELADAAYPVAARHQGANTSVDLELELWRALEQTVTIRGKTLLQAACAGATDPAEISELSGGNR
jgi:hypothetical protein